MSDRTWNDQIKQLGDSIVGLTLMQAKELADYLKEVHGIEPAAGGAVMMAGLRQQQQHRQRKKRPASM